jgi:hypothetical protein
MLQNISGTTSAISGQFHEFFFGINKCCYQHIAASFNSGYASMSINYPNGS